MAMCRGRASSEAKRPHALAVSTPAEEEDRNMQAGSQQIGSGLQSP